MPVPLDNSHSATPPALVSAIAFTSLALATLFPVWGDLAEGWPFSHEGPAFAQRTLIYARHLAEGDPFPLWASVDNFGFGSPMPLVYHKLFYLVAAPLLLATGSMTGTLATAILIFLVAGAFGVERLLREIGASRLASTIGGGSLIVANYTVTNWLVRGNVGELSAAMMVPWALYGFIRSLRTGRVEVSLALTLGLAWLGHSVLAFYVALLLATTYVAMASTGLAPWSLLRPRTAWRPIALFALIVLPYLVPMLIVGADYDFTRILTPPFRPEDQFRPVAWYLWDTQWHFGRTAAGLTRQLDFAMLALAAVSLFVLVWGADPLDAPLWRSTLRPILPLVIVFALTLMLQLPISLPIYHAVPGALFIQFPWRLLAVLTPTLIACAIYLADKSVTGEVRVFALAAAAAWMVAGSGAFVPHQDPRLHVNDVTLANFSFSGFREYEPAQAAGREARDEQLARWWKEAGCTVDRLDPADQEHRQVRLQIACGRGGVMPLPLFASPLHRIVNSRFDRVESCLALPEMPGLCAATIPAGASIVTITLPSFTSIPRWLWQRLQSR